MKNLLLCLLFFSPTYAETPVEPTPAEDPPIILPQVVPDVPTPPLAAETVVLNEDELYVIESDGRCIIVGSSTSGGAVRIYEDEGPIKIKSRFVDSAGHQTKTYKRKHVYTVEGSKEGLVELLIFRPAMRKAEDVIRVMLDVKTGVGPQPPPEPTPDPTPTPEPNPPEPDPQPVPVTGLRVLFVYDNSLKAFTGAQRNTLHSAEVRDWLTKNTDNDNWRMWDVTQTKDLSAEEPVLRTLWNDSKSKVDTSRGCQMIIATDTSAEVMDMPSESTTKATIAETLKVLDKYRKQ